MAAYDRSGAESFDGTVRCLVPVAERLRTFPVRRVLAHRADEQVTDGSRRHQARGPDLPVYEHSKGDERMLLMCFATRTRLRVCVAVNTVSNILGPTDGNRGTYRVSSGTPNASSQGESRITLRVTGTTYWHGCCTSWFLRQNLTQSEIRSSARIGTYAWCTQKRGKRWFPTACPRTCCRTSPS